MIIADGNSSFGYPGFVSHTSGSKYCTYEFKLKSDGQNRESGSHIRYSETGGEATKLPLPNGKHLVKKKS